MSEDVVQSSADGHLDIIHGESASRAFGRKPCRQIAGKRGDQVFDGGRVLIRCLKAGRLTHIHGKVSEIDRALQGPGRTGTGSPLIFPRPAFILLEILLVPDGADRPADEIAGKAFALQTPKVFESHHPAPGWKIASYGRLPAAHLENALFGDPQHVLADKQNEAGSAVHVPAIEHVVGPNRFQAELFTHISGPIEAVSMRPMAIRSQAIRRVPPHRPVWLL